MENKNPGLLLRAKKLYISEKVFISLILSIFIVLTRENFLIKNENVVVEMISFESTVHFPLEKSKNANETDIDNKFKQRSKILYRSCSFFNKLKAANEQATINQLKEIHFILHELSKSREEIAKTLEPYEDIENTLDENQEKFYRFEKIFAHRLWAM